MTLDGLLQTYEQDVTNSFTCKEPMTQMFLTTPNATKSCTIQVMQT